MEFYNRRGEKTNGPSPIYKNYDRYGKEISYYEIQKYQNRFNSNSSNLNPSFGTSSVTISAGDIEVIVSLGFLCLVGYTIFVLIPQWFMDGIEWLENLRHSAFPYKYIADFYHYTFVVPFVKFMDGWKWIWNIDFIESTSLDGIINIFMLIGYFILCLVLLGVVLGLVSLILNQKIETENDIDFSKMLSFYLVPAFLGVIWYGIAAIFN